MLVNVPEPAAFVLPKLIVSQERTNAAKRARDIKIALEIGEFLLRDAEQRQKLQHIFADLPSKWQKTVRNILVKSDALAFMAALFP